MSWREQLRKAIQWKANKNERGQRVTRHRENWNMVDWLSYFFNPLHGTLCSPLLRQFNFRRLILKAKWNLGNRKRILLFVAVGIF